LPMPEAMNIKASMIRPAIAAPSLSRSLQSP
jgi:hypothetical protein